jgi:hypothetical protein
MAKKSGANRRRFRVLPTVLLTAAILGLPTAVYAWGRSSSAFHISHVRVTGTTLVPARTVAGMLRSRFLGRNLFTVTTADVRTALHTLPYVQDAEVDRDFPNTLKVNVVEYRPALYVLAGDGWFTVADDGYVICPASVPPGRRYVAADGGQAGAASGTHSGATHSPSPSAQPAATPSGAASPAATGGAAGGSTSSAKHSTRDLTSVASPSAALTKGPPSARLHLPGLQVRAALTVGGRLPAGSVGSALAVLDVLPADLRQRLTVVQVADGGSDLALRFGALTVRWGDGGRLLAKLLALRAVLKEYRGGGKAAAFIDVSVPDRVLARPILK